MRWKRKRKAITPSPKHGDSRVRSGFLLFPVTLCDETRWLENAQWGERYFHGFRGVWEKTRWIN